VTLDSAAVAVEGGGAAPDLLAGVTIADNADDAPIISTNGSVNVNILGEYTVSYTGSDESANQSDPVERVYTVVDTTAPVLTVDPALVEIGLGDTIDYLAGVAADDAVDGDLTSNVETDVAVDVTTVGETVVTYTVSDYSGNETQAVRTYRVGCQALNGSLLIDPNGDSAHFLSITLTDDTIVTSTDLSPLDGGATAKAIEITPGGSGDQQTLSGTTVNAGRYVVTGDAIQVELVKPDAGDRTTWSLTINSSCANVSRRDFTLSFVGQYLGDQPGQMKAALAGDDVGLALAELTVVDSFENLDPKTYDLTVYIDLNGNDSVESFEASTTVSVTLAADEFVGLIEPVDPDTDADGLPDWWETQYFGDLTAPADGDGDGDGITNAKEFERGTHPADTDNPDKALYTVTVEIEGSGSGFVSLDVGDTVVESGTELDLTATPIGGSFFAGWSGDVESSGPVTVTVEGDLLLIATFARSPVWYLAFEPGWNFVGSPVYGFDSFRSVLRPVRQAVGGNVLEWESDNWQRMNQALAPVGGAAYWVYSNSTETETSDLLEGIPASLRLSLKTGWNPISVSEAARLPTDALLSPIAWRYEAGRYQAVASGEKLEPLKGYYLYCFDDVEIDLIPVE
jgi:hypothetical protein